MTLLMCSTHQQFATMAQLVGTPEGEVLVQTCDWTGYLAAYLKKIKSLKTYHHFNFESHCLGDILLKTTSQDPVKKKRHLRTEDHTVVPSALPPTIQPCGLTNERQWYLFDKICEFVLSNVVISLVPILPYQNQCHLLVTHQR